MKLFIRFYIVSFILVIFSYLVPKESYKAFIQFFISIFVILLMMKPVLSIIMVDYSDRLYESFQDFNSKISEIGEASYEDWNMYEYFIAERKGE